MLIRTFVKSILVILVFATIGASLGWAQSDDPSKTSSGEPFPPILEGLLVVIFTGVVLLIVCKPSGKVAG